MKMKKFDKDGVDGYTVNYAEVLKAKDVLSVTKLLATQLMQTPYMTVGDFLRTVADDDLETLIDGNEKHIGDQLLISEMLATAEGLDSSKDFGEFKDRAAQLLGFLIVESLKRKGLVKVYYENMSFDESLGDKIIVEKI